MSSPKFCPHPGEVFETTQQDLRVLLDHAPDAIGRFDRELRHVYVNEATARANGRPASDFLGKRMRELGHTEEVSTLIESNLRRVFSAGVEHTVELLFHGPDGEVWYQSRMAPEFGPDGSVDYVLVVSRDITQRKQVERALREAERKAALAGLASSLAHAINNPLTSVVNAIYLLQHNPSLDENAREVSALAAHELERVVAICRHLLSLSAENAPDKGERLPA